MSSCNSFPTLTSTTQLVTNSLSTSTISHVTILPPTTTTITLTPSCTASSGSCAPIVTVSQIPGGTSTVVDTVTVTVPITSSQVTTLWGSSCSPTNPNTPSTPTPSEIPTPSPSLSFSTPPPSVFVTSSSSTAANGSVTPVILTRTSTVPPILITPTASTLANANAGEDSSRNLGPIIGGVVGGAVGLCALIFLVWFFIRRRQRWDDIFDDVPVVDASTKKKEKFTNSGPKPYQYGLVGYTKTSSLTSAPSSPPPGAATLSDGGLDRSHYRSSSTTPLLSLASGNTTHRPNTSPPARPPSSSSGPGIGSQADTNTQGQMWDPHGLYNSPSQSHSPSGPSAMGSVGPIAETIGRTDGDHRAGSPVSFQERRILQVTNADLLPLSPQSPEHGSPFLVSIAPTEVQRDGKGRMAIQGEKAPVVHLDGGRYQESAAGSSSAAVTAPPAYSE